MKRTAGWQALLGIFLMAAPASATVSAGTFFDKGKTRLTLTGGWGQAFNQDYFVAGLGAGYYFAKGLEAGVDTEAWLGNSPKITKVSPEIRYIIPVNTNYSPYVGAFYRRTLYEDLDDADSLGARAGIFTTVAKNTYLGAGAVYEQQLDCDSGVYDHCYNVYPEFSVMVMFGGN